MTSLVTGGSGFVGSHLTELLIARGHTVRCLVRRTSDLRWLEGLPLEYIYGDLFDLGALRKAVEGVDYVYHSAGLTKAKTKDEYYRANTLGTKNLLEAALHGAPQIRRFVLVSSQTAAGPSPGRLPITEDTPAHPITTYGRSKWMAEQECSKLKDKLPVTIVRPPAVYGPRDKDVLEFFHTMSMGIQPMVGLSEKYVSLIHARDLVRGIVMASEWPGAVGNTYFVTSKEYYGWKEVGEVTRRIIGTRAVRIRIPAFGVYVVAAFAEFLALFSKKPALINFEKARDMVQDYWTCDGSKAKRDFGFEAEISLEEGIRETVGWYRSNGWL